MKEGQTDVFIMVHRFDDQGGSGRMDGLYSQWTTRAAGGFRPADDSTFSAGWCPPLALAIKCASLVRIAGTLAEVYLGRDAGRRVLRGQVTRGVAEQIGAVLWFSDLRHYTHLSDTAEPEHIIPLLNDYAEAVISSIENGRRRSAEADRGWRARYLPRHAAGARPAARPCGRKRTCGSGWWPLNDGAARPGPR